LGVSEVGEEGKTKRTTTKSWVVFRDVLAGPHVCFMSSSSSSCHGQRTSSSSSSGRHSLPHRLSSYRSVPHHRRAVCRTPSSSYRVVPRVSYPIVVVSCRTPSLCRLVSSWCTLSLSCRVVPRRCRYPFIVVPLFMLWWW